MKKLLTSLISVVLMCAILAPSFAKLSHALYEHQEVMCADNSLSHVHEIEFDCEFQKFKLSPQTYIDFVEISEIMAFRDQNKAPDYYTFLSNFQKLPFALRGPPSLVRT